MTAVWRRLLLALVCALALAPAATAATTPTGPVFDVKGHLIETPFVPTAPAARLTKPQALGILRSYPKVHAWLARYPATGLTDEEEYDSATRSWTVKIWWGAAGEIAQGKVDDQSGAVTEAWTGPQVAWGMARGAKGAFGGTKINTPWVWGAFCLVFLIGLGDFRRPLSLRNLDLVMLLSPTASLWFFNHGNVFTAVPLFYPALVWVVARGVWIGFTGRGSRARVLWPTWVLLAATVFVAGFRVGLNLEASNVIDVGYSGVIGAERIVTEGEAPWGNFPVEDNRPACGPADGNGEIRDHVQTNGRCESANPLGDTYGPTAYEAYIPGYLIRGWSGRWDDLPAAHFTSIAFDLLTIIGLWLVGLRFGGARLAAALAFAWAAYPFTQYASSSNTNDAIMPCLLVYGFWLAASPVGRGVFGALSGWSKFASLIAMPLWLTYPDRRPSRRFAAAFAVATVAVFSVVLLEPSPLHELRLFWDRTIAWQTGRSSPFSLWDWRQYHARGLPNLHLVQVALEVVLVGFAVAVAWFPRRKSPLQLAALTAALLAGFELVQTYWLYTYIPWFFPFAAIAVLAPAARARRPVPVAELDYRSWSVVPSAG
ncbi:MAG: hypothetical protein ACRDL2_11185 [Gaiellaceae bacterium]